MPFIVNARRRLMATAALATALPFADALAQDFPARPITIVVPFTAGGGVDAVARLLADRLRVSMKQSVVVDNKPGASGMLGAQTVVKAAPDGHTWLLGSAGETAINPYVYKGRMSYAPEKDLAPITAVTRIPNVMVVRPSLPVNSVDEFLAHARKNPGKVSYSSSGVGNVQHLNGELLEEFAGLQMIHIPYKGASGQLIDVTTGVVDMTFVSYTAARPFIQGGKVKPLAVTSARRASFAPNVPALAESKALARYELENWFGLFVPAATPPALQDRINAAVTQALADQELVRKLREQGGEPAPMTRAQFSDFVKAESAKFGRIVQAANVTAE